MLMHRNVAAGIGSNEQGEYCRAALQRGIAKSRDIYCLLYFLLYFKGRALDIAPQVRNCRGAQVHAATKQRCTYLPYTFPPIAGTHLPTPRGWRVESLLVLFFILVLNASSVLPNFRDIRAVVCQKPLFHTPPLFWPKFLLE